MGKLYRFVNLVGLEVEGNWKGEAGISPFPFPLKRDVSVQRIGTHAHYGEAATPDPIKPDQVEEWLTTHWPNASGDDCGLHCHVSVVNPNINYARLQDKSFYDRLIKELELWGAEQPTLNRKADPDQQHIFWHRLGVHGPSQKNRFCSRIFDPHKQMKAKDKSDNVRRSLLNYCYAMHGTLECRVFPMFPEGPKVAASAVMVFVNLVENFLAEWDLKEEKGIRIKVRGR